MRRIFSWWMETTNRSFVDVRRRDGARIKLYERNIPVLWPGDDRSDFSSPVVKGSIRTVLGILGWLC